MQRQERMQGSPDVKLKKGDIPAGKPNLYTSPGKKGSYGFNKTTLSERKGAGGMQGEYRYVATPFGTSASPATTATASDVPFVPCNPPKKGGYGYAKTNLGNKAVGVTGEFGYLPHGDGAPAAKAAVGKLETPFVPPRAPRAGHNRTLAAFPVYYADPDQLKQDARRQARQLEIQAMAASNPWHPPSVPKMAATRSVVRMNI